MDCRRTASAVKHSLVSHAKRLHISHPRRLRCIGSLWGNIYACTCVFALARLAADCWFLMQNNQSHCEANAATFTAVCVSPACLHCLTVAGKWLGLLSPAPQAALMDAEVSLQSILMPDTVPCCSNGVMEMTRGVRSQLQGLIRCACFPPRPPPQAIAKTEILFVRHCFSGELLLAVAALCRSVFKMVAAVTFVSLLPPVVSQC